MRLRTAAVAASLACTVVVGAGCSSSSSSDDAKSTTTTLAPEDILVPNAEVTAGLNNLRTLVAQAKTEAASKASTVGQTVDDSWSQWLKIEGRIKKNDTGAYLEFEDALSDMRIGAQEDEPAKVEKGATSVDALITSYLADFPG
jgi:hypothetical protein